MQQFFVVYGYLKQTKDIETILANVKARANFMPEKTITMYRKLGKSRVEISALNH